MQEQRILKFLEGTSESNPKPVREIAVAIFGKGTPKRKVNPSLYKLQREGYTKKIAEEDGSNPRWYSTGKE